MSKLKLTKEEQAIENSLEQYVPVGKEEFNGIVQAISATKHLFRKFCIRSLRHKAGDENYKFNSKN